jgi:hypothetical protein
MCARVWEKHLLVITFTQLVATPTICRSADLLIWVHGAAAVNQWYMKRFSSLLELRSLSE